MPVEILMPELGESVHEATVSRWIVHEGDFVKEDDPVVEIMTDKVNTELPSPATGVLSKILVPEGASVHVFEAVGVIEESGEAEGRTTKDEREGKDEARRSKVEQDGKDQVAGLEGEAPSEPRPSTFDLARSPEAGGRRWLTPVVRSMAKQHGISETELSALAGSGAGGRVTKKDVEAYIASGKAGATVSPKTPEFQEKPTLVLAGPEQEVVLLTQFRKMLAEAMVRANAVPTVSTCVQVDVTAMVRFREANKEAFQAQNGVKLTYTPFFIKALSDALVEFPTVNGSLQGDKAVVNRAVHMGVAVALGSKGDEGLIVPVIRDCHKKSVVELAKDLEAIAAKARNNSLKPDDVQGGTFTLTNPGSYGALFGTPMIVAPQGAIAGAYGIQKMPIVVGEDMIAVRSVMYLVLTYDHRLIDGLLAGRFLQSAKKRLEEFQFFS